MIEPCLEMLYWPDAEARADAVRQLQAEGEAALTPLFDILAASDTRSVPAQWTTPEARQAALERAQESVAIALTGMGELFVRELTDRLLALETTFSQASIEQVCRRIGEPAIDPLIELLTWDAGDKRSIHARLKREYGVLLQREQMQKARDNVLSALAAIESQRVVSYFRNCSGDYTLAQQRDWRMGSIVAGVFGLFAVILLKTTLVTEFSWVTEFGGLVLACVSGLLIAVTWSEVRGRRDETAKLLGTVTNPFLIGIVASYLNSKDSHLREAAKMDLIRLLPCVREEHQGLLAPDEINGLFIEVRRVLARSPSNEFVLVVLSALRYIGNAGALPHLRQMMAHENEMPSNVIIAVRECLACVEQRVEESRQVDTLLRASSPASAAPNTLLRAAQGTDLRMANEEEQRQLLRPR